MSYGDRKSSLGPLLVTVPVLALVLFAVSFCFQPASVEAGSASTSASSSVALAPTATFPANAPSLGAIPDAIPTTPTCQNASTTMRDVTFTVTGLTGSVSSVAVNFSASHTYLQDLEVSLIAPSAQSLLLFSATGTTTTVANSCAGSANDLSTANTYTFADTAAANWWTTAATNPVPTSTNRTVVTGIGGTTNPPATTSLNSAFAAATANGTWTLRFRDRGAGDTGTVTAANLTVTTAGGGADAILDYNGDGKTDFVVVRNTGGGPGGQISFLYKLNGTSSFQGKFWGLATDFFLDGNWDGDLNDDIAVWRPGSAGTAAFYVLRSTDNTALVDFFGQSGDEPTVVDDYNGDGRTDFAVYRAGATAGAPSTWFWRSATTPGGAVNYVPWGQNGDFPAPGDYDGDGKADYVIQRNNGGGQARFWMSQTTAGFNSIVFGTPTDVIVPGDYDGDGKTDIATVRGISGQINWFWHPSGGGADQQVVFGLSASDFPTQGDYDGDGKTDVAIWRPDADPANCNFWTRSNAGAVTVVEFGQNGDYPVANYNTH